MLEICCCALPGIGLIAKAKKKKNIAQTGIVVLPRCRWNYSTLLLFARQHGHGRDMSPISLASTYISSVDSRDHRRHHGANHHARHAPRRHDHRHRAGRPSLDGSRQIPPREMVVEARRVGVAIGNNGVM